MKIAFRAAAAAAIATATPLALGLPAARPALAQAGSVPATKAPSAAPPGFEAVSSPREARCDYDGLVREWLELAERAPGSPGARLALARLPAIRGYARNFSEAVPRLEAFVAGSATPVADATGDGFARDVARALLVDAYAERGEMEKARVAHEARGLVLRFLAIGPFGHSERAIGDQTFPIEEELLGRELDASGPRPGAYGPVFFRPARARGLDGAADLFEPLRPDKGCAFGVAQVRVPGEAPRTAVVSVVTGAAFRLFVNGQLALDADRHRKELSSALAVRVTLSPGWNRLVLKSGTSGSARFEVRLSDSQGYAFPEVEVEGEARVWPLPEKPAPVDPAPFQLPGFDRGSALGLAAAGVDAVLHERGIEALALLEEAATKAPAEPGIRYFAGLANERASHLPENHRRNRAREHYQAALAKGWWPARERLAEFHRRDDRPDKATEELRALVADCPGHFRALQSMAEVARAAGWEREAVEAAQLAAQAAPESARPLMFLARYEEERGNRAAAAKLLEKAYALDRTLLWAKESLAGFARDAGDVKGALETYRALAAEHPERRDLRGEIAELLRLSGDVDGAVKIYEQLAAEQPLEPLYPRRAGEALVRAGRDKDAIPHLRGSLALEPAQHEIRRLVDRLEGREWDFSKPWEQDGLDLARKAPGQAEHPKANSICLLDQTVQRVYGDGSSSEVVHQAYKVLDEKGVERYHAVQIPGELLQMRTITAEGEVLEPTLAADSAEVLPPGLAPGAAIEYRYRRDRPAPSGFQYHGGNFFFRDPDWVEPFLLSRYVLIVDKAYPLRFRTRNTKAEPRVEDRGDVTVYTFEFRDQDRVEPEPLMPEREEMLPHVACYTERTWEEVNQVYRDGALGRTLPTPEIERFARSAVKGLPEGAAGDRPRAEALYRAVHELIADEVGPSQASAILAERKGSRQVLLLALLEVAGVPAGLVRVAPNRQLTVDPDWGLVRPELFPGALISVEPRDGTEPIYLVTSIRHLPFGQLPAYFQGGTAFLPGLHGGTLRPLPRRPLEEQASASTLRMTLRRGGSARCEVIVAQRESDRYRLKEQVLTATPRQLANWVAGRANEMFRGATLERFQFPGLWDGKTPAERLFEWERPFEVAFSCGVPEWVRPAEGGFELATGLPPLNLLETYGGKEKREHDAVLRRTQVERDRATIDLGDAYRLRHLPQGLVLKSSFASYSLTFKIASEGVLEVERLFTQEPARLTPEQYPEFVRFCREVDVAEKRRILLDGR